MLWRRDRVGCIVLLWVRPTPTPTPTPNTTTTTPILWLLLLLQVLAGRRRAQALRGRIELLLPALPLPLTLTSATATVRVLRRGHLHRHVLMLPTRGDGRLLCLLLHVAPILLLLLLRLLGRCALLRGSVPIPARTPFVLIHVLLGRWAPAIVVGSSRGGGGRLGLVMLLMVASSNPSKVLLGRWLARAKPGILRLPRLLLGRRRVALRGSPTPAHRHVWRRILLPRRLRCHALCRGAGVGTSGIVSVLVDDGAEEKREYVKEKRGSSRTSMRVLRMEARIICCGWSLSGEAPRGDNSTQALDRTHMLLKLSGIARMHNPCTLNQVSPREKQPHTCW